MATSTSPFEANTPDLAPLRPELVAPSANPERKNIAWWTLVAVSIAADFLMLPMVTVFSWGPGPPTLPQAILVFGMLGSTLAQGSLLAAWLAWGDSRFSHRLIWHWIIAGGLCCIWLAGVALAAPSSFFHEFALTIALTVPVVSLGAQLPLWAARQLFRCRLVPTTSTFAAAEPLSIRDLMLATLLVGASFAIARLSPGAQQEKDFWIFWCITMTGAATFSLLAILPTAAMLLRPRPFGRAIAYSLAYAAVPIILLWGGAAIMRYYGIGRLPPWTMFVGMSCLVLCYAGTAILAAAAARNRGYLLVWHH